MFFLFVTLTVVALTRQSFYRQKGGTMKQTGKRENRKIRCIGALLAVMMLFVTGCEWARDLSEEFEEEKVLASAEEVIEDLNACDFEAIEAKVNEEFQEDINAGMLEENLAEKMKELGEFDSYTDEAAVGLKSKDYDGEIAVAVMNPIYENGRITVTISYNTDYEIIGFYVK